MTRRARRNHDSMTDARPGDRAGLEPGMTLIVHPNTYYPEVGYPVLRDTVLTETGVEVLRGTPHEPFEVPA
jgi:Xaa-Pro aminopeptidase